jgi:hypothetical protein
MKLRTLVGTGIVTLALPFAGLEAQVDYSRLEVTGGYAGWTGDEVDNFDPGFLAQATLFGGVSSTFAVGLTGTYADIPFGPIDASGDEWGLGVTLRKALGRHRTTRAFFDGYAGWSRLSTRVETAEVSTNGFVIGPALGLEVPFAERWTLVGRGHYYYQTYSDVLINEGINAGDGISGWRWGVQAGLAFGPLR